MKVTDLGAITCAHCGTPSRRKRISTDGEGTHPVIVQLCLCDARICPKCKSYTTNPKAHACVHCRRIF